jgi:GT2 family glycosyltransferase
LDSNRDRDFSSKVYAIQAGIEKLKGAEYDFIGNLDTDVSFEPNYYESILTMFQENPKLGIAGGTVFEACGRKWIRLHTSDSWSVSGAIQMFRRQCFKDIGGYIPLKIGGEDTIAEVMARMHGWEVKTFPIITVLHHRRIGVERANILSARFHQGRKEYSCGYHPLFEIARCISRVREKPYMFGSLLRLYGYCYAFLRREPQSISKDIISFLRQEQMGRLIALLRW